MSKPYSEQQLYTMLETWLPAKIEVAAVTDPDIAVDQQQDVAEPAAATLDEAVLAPLRARHPALLGRIISTYLAHAPTLLEDMRKAVDEGDCERLSRHAHSLKSSSANLGATALSGYCRDLEKAANGDAIEECRALAEKIFSIFASVRRDLEADVADLKLPAGEVQNIA